jgi:hypothetical protein
LSGFALLGAWPSSADWEIAFKDPVGLLIFLGLLALGLYLNLF